MPDLNHSQDVFEDIARIVVFAAPVVRVVFDARVFVDADLILVDNPAQ